MTKSIAPFFSETMKGQPRLTAEPQSSQRLICFVLSGERPESTKPYVRNSSFVLTVEPFSLAVLSTAREKTGFSATFAPVVKI